MLPAAHENERALLDTSGNGEGYLYRYRDLVEKRAEWVRQIIVDSNLFFCSPATINDPFDCQARFHVMGSNASLKKEMRTRATKRMAERGMPRRLRREVLRAPIRRGALVEDLTEGMQNTIDHKMGVLSLSATHENILMWSHYACGHQGVCLQFRVEAEYGFFAEAQPMTYSDQLPIPNLTCDYDEHINQLLLTKAADWRYEREWRMLRTIGHGSDRFHETLLSGVILGARISAADQETVCGWVKARAEAVEIYRAEKDPKRFALRFHQIA